MKISVLYFLLKTVLGPDDLEVYPGKFELELNERLGGQIRGSVVVGLSCLNYVAGLTDIIPYEISSSTY